MTTDQQQEYRNPQYWLAEVDSYGTGWLKDGPHSNRESVEQALYLYARLGFSEGKRYACAEVHLSAVEAIPHGANEDALGTLNSIGLRP